MTKQNLKSTAWAVAAFLLFVLHEVIADSVSDFIFNLIGG